MAAKAGKYYSVAEIAAMFGKAERTIQRCVKEARVQSKPKFTGAKHRVYLLEAVAKALYGNAPPQEADGEQVKATDRNQLAQAKLKETELLELQKKLLRVDEVQETLATFLKTMSQTILTYPDICERDHAVTKEVSILITKLCDGLLKLIHDALHDVSYAGYGDE